MRRFRLSTVAVLVTAAFFPGVSASASSVTTCSGTLPPGTYDNVVVPAGEGCTIDQSTITGTVTASYPGDSIIITDSIIGGRVMIDHMSPNGRSAIVLFGNELSRNLTVTDNVPGWGLVIGDCPSTPTCNIIGGNLTISDNAPLEGVGRLNTNVVGGKLVVEGNSFYGDALTVDANRVRRLRFRGNSGNLYFGIYAPNSAEQDMVCRDNGPSFVSGGTNTARRVIDCNS